MSSRGNVPECRGAGVKVTGRPKGGARRRTWICAVCGRSIALNYDGSVRWHTPNPRRREQQP